MPVRAPFAHVQVAVENRASFCDLPLTIAERLGYFAAEGVDVQIREFAEPGRALQALLGGTVTAMSGPYSASLTLQARGHSFPSIVLQGRAPQLVLGVSRRSMAGFRTMRDFQGRRVAITGLSSGSHRMMLLLLQSVRVDPAAVQFVALDSPTTAAASFRNGLVDAICYTDPVMTQLEQEGELRVVADTRTLRGSSEVFGGPMPAACLSVPAEYLASQEAVCQAMVNAMVRALKWLQTAGPSDINRTVPEAYFRGDRSLYLAAFSRARDAWTSDGLMPENGPATAAKVLARLNVSLTAHDIDLSRTYTNALAIKAKARYRA
ncbi:MAG: ABC transporter substrate-binding protein [Hydrogenophaga sp.]|nr:ABC transporter substrate-binding protein [Hydrogenophaga sp.]